MSETPKQSTSARTAIPKRIIQTGKTAPGSVRARAMVGTVRQLNPDFEYVFFDDADVENFIKTEFPQYQKVFESFQVPIQRYDFFRYLAVYRLGGFYFDLDVLLAQPLDDLLDFDCVFPFEVLTFSRYLRSQFQIDWEVGNYAFGAVPNHPFLAAVIESCIRGQQDPKWVQQMMRGVPLLSRKEFSVLYSSGPGMVTRTLAENPELARTVKVLMPNNICDPRNWWCFGKYGAHMMDSSWRKPSGHLHKRFIRFLAKNWEGWRFRSLVRESEAMRRIKDGSYSVG